MLKTYRVTINGVRTALQLTEEDARRRGLTQVVEPAAPVAAEKPKKARAPRTKPAATRNKAAAKGAEASAATGDAAGVESPGIVPDLDGKGASGAGA